MTIQLTKLHCGAGAPLGRSATHRTGMTKPVFEVERVPLIDGGYDCGGAYWGDGERLWCADFTTPRTGTRLVRFFIRASDREAAMKEVRSLYPDALFRPEMGSVIEQTVKHLSAYLERCDDEEIADDVEREIEMLQEELDDLRGQELMVQIRAAVASMPEVSVEIDRRIGTVCVSAPGQDDIFFQGEQAEEFIAEVDRLYEAARDATEDECALLHVAPYCECVWN